MPVTTNGKDDLSETEIIDGLFDTRDLAKSLLSALKSNNRRLKRLEDWREHQVTGFLRILVETITDLVAAHKKNRVSTVAWLTRNLLELSIWSEYCAASESNSLSFFNDSLKDLYGGCAHWSKLTF